MRKQWLVAAGGYDALGVPRPGVSKTRIGKFEAKLDQIIANAEGAPPAPNDAKLKAAVTAAEATWAKPRSRADSKQADPAPRRRDRPANSRGHRLAGAYGARCAYLYEKCQI